MWKKGEVQERKTLEAVSSVEQLPAKVSAMAEKRTVLATKCKELALKVQCMPGLADAAKILLARVAKLQRAFMTRTSKVRTMRRTMDTDVVAEHPLVERSEHTARIAQ